MERKVSLFAADNGFSGLGWLGLVVLAAAVVVAIAFGVQATFYFAIILVPVVFAILIILCLSGD